jgi:hypothetical protein
MVYQPSPVAGIAFLVAAGTMAEFVAKACSSPQTTELNADARAPTLMKWVNVGVAEGVLMTGIAFALSPEVGGAFVMGAGLELAITYAEYLHARRAGLASSAPPTEAYGGSGAPQQAQGGGAAWGWAGGGSPWSGWSCGSATAPPAGAGAW